MQECNDLDLTTRKKWKVIIIAQYDNDDRIVKAAYGELEKSILNQNHKQKVEYLIFQFNQRINKINVRKVFNDAEKVVIKTIERKIITNFYTGVELKDLLLKYKGKEPRFQKGNLLITWGHGRGYGLFPELDQAIFSIDSNLEPHLADKAMQYTAILNRRDFLRTHFPDDYFDQAKFDNDFTEIINRISNISNRAISSTPKILSLKDFKNAIKEGIGFVDVFITMNCFMQMFETGYFLKDAVGVLISPQTTISFWGYNYNQLFKALHRTEGASIEYISHNVCSYFSIKYFEQPLAGVIQRHENEIKPQRTAFSANNLLKYCDLKNNFAQVLETINKNPGSKVDLCINEIEVLLRDVLRRSRDKCSALIKTKDFEIGAIDLNTFLIGFGNLINFRFFEAEYERAFEAFRISLKETIIASHFPGQLFTRDFQEDNLPVSGPQGISIFFPNRNSEDRRFLRYLRAEFNFDRILDLPAWNTFLDQFLS